MADLGIRFSDAASILGPVGRYTPGQEIRYSFLTSLPSLSTYEGFDNYKATHAGSDLRTYLIERDKRRNQSHPESLSVRY